jgi:hypothetical protein
MEQFLLLSQVYESVELIATILANTFITSSNLFKLFGARSIKVDQEGQ